MSVSATTTADGTQVRVTEQTGIHWSTLYLHTVPGALKAVCIVSRHTFHVFLIDTLTIDVMCADTFSMNLILMFILFYRYLPAPPIDLCVPWLCVCAMQHA